MKRLLKPYSDQTIINKPLDEIDARLLRGVYTVDKWEHAEDKLNDLKYTYNMPRDYDAKPMVPPYSYTLDFDRMADLTKWYRINKAGANELTEEEPVKLDEI